MIRVRTLFVTVLPSMIAGGFLFASAFGHAETGRDGALGSWPEASDTATGRVLVAQADPWGASPRGRRPPVPPAPPAPYAHPAPPAPPAPPVRRGRPGVSVSIQDGQIQIDGLAGMIEGQLAGVTALLDNMTDVSPDVRDRVRSRVQQVRRTVNARLGKLKSMDLDKIGPEMERMGDEIEQAMAGLDKDLESLGHKLGQHFAKKLSQDLARGFDARHDDNDHDDAEDEDDLDDEDRDAVVMPPSVDADVDPGSLPSIGDLKSLTLEPGQKAALAQLRADADRQVAAAKRSLDRASDELQEALGDASVSERDIERKIDAVSQQEVIIRKARILTWVKARNVLHKDQRKLVESAARRGR